MTLTVTVVGAPAAGKSTWCASVSRASGQAVVCMDAVVQRHDAWSHDLEWKAWARLVRREHLRPLVVDGFGGLFFDVPHRDLRDDCPELAAIVVLRPAVPSGSLHEVLVDRIRRRARALSLDELTIADEWLEGPEGRSLVTADDKYEEWREEGYSVIDVEESRDA